MALAMMVLKAMAMNQEQLEMMTQVIAETLKQIHGGATLAEVEGVGSKPEEKTDQPEEPRP